MFSGSTGASCSTLFCSQWPPGIQSEPALYQHPNSGETDTSPLGSPPKSQNAGAHSSPLLPSCWSIFIMAALKSFLDNSSMCVISMLVSVDCLFLLNLRCSWFFVWWVIFCCILGVWGIMRPWILNQCFLFSESALRLLRCKNGGMASLLSGRGGSQGFPLTIHWYWGRSRGPSLLLGKGEISGSPLDLCWHHPGLEREGHLAIARGLLCHHVLGASLLPGRDECPRSPLKPFLKSPQGVGEGYVWLFTARWR